MEELDLILTGFSDIEYEIGMVLSILMVLEELYNIDSQGELKAIIIVLIRVLGSLKEDMRKNVIKLDEYIIQNENK